MTSLSANGNAKVGRDPAVLSVSMASAADSLHHRLAKLRNCLGDVSAHRKGLHAAGTTAIRRVAAAELALSEAKVAACVEDVSVAVENFSAMWQELRAELDMAHVLAASPE
ncbi:hypothetical protein EBZ80_09290 [bacterium]|nr:hypothetical protein [bacterium]